MRTKNGPYMLHVYTLRVDNNTRVSYYSNSLVVANAVGGLPITIPAKILLYRSHGRPVRFRSLQVTAEKADVVRE